MLKSVTIKVPGTCGELIQSHYDGTECLISLPIDRYTKIKATYDHEALSCSSLRPKSLMAFEVICDYLNISLSERKKIGFEISSELETGIGMASSTADVYGIMVAVSLLSEAMLTPETFGKLCTQIEPTDGIMFKDWTLFDHLKGQVLETYHVSLPMNLFVLKSDEQVDTVALRKASDYCEKMVFKSSRPLQYFKTFVQTNSLEALGLAATTSILENEVVLKKPMLKELIQLSQQLGAIGVVGAHSGSILALAFESNSINLEIVLEKMNQWVLESPYTHVEIVSATCGGYLLIEKVV